MSKTKGIQWDRQPLGKVPDTTLAERLGVFESAVRGARIRRGIKTYSAARLAIFEEYLRERRSLIPPISIEYVAGFFDGEGSVALDKRSGGDYVRLSMSNTNRKALENIRRFIGTGTIGPPRKTKLSKKPCYALRMQGVKILPLIEALIPRCTIKRPKLEKARAFLSQRRKRGRLPTLPHLLWLRDRLGLCPSEIAAMYGCATAAVWGHFRREKREGKLR
jgi:hypothetical protein